MTEYIKRNNALAVVNEAVTLWNHPIDGISKTEYLRIRLKNIPAADVRPAVRGNWEKVGEQMLINLENAREQYAELGYPHRKILNLRCSLCRKVTMVDSSIAYDFCPHCGADMRGDNK